jgi:hypothetical protein
MTALLGCGEKEVKEKSRLKEMGYQGHFLGRCIVSLSPSPFASRLLSGQQPLHHHDALPRLRSKAMEPAVLRLKPLKT